MITGNTCESMLLNTCITFGQNANYQSLCVAMCLVSQDRLCDNHSKTNTSADSNSWGMHEMVTTL